VVAIVVALLVGAIAAFAGLGASAQAAGCDTSWTHAGGGLWTTAGNWDNGVPTAGENVCIALTGTYTVTIDVGYSTPSLGSLTVGAASGSTTQTLELRGVDGDGTTVLTATSVTTTAGGAITMDCPATCGTGAERIDATVAITNGGTITTSGTSAKLSGPLTNNGSFTVSGPTTLQRYNNPTPAPLTNHGTITIGTGETLTTIESVVNGTGGHIVATGSGTLNDDGLIGAVFEEGAGTTSGTTPVTLTGGTTLDLTGTGASHFEMLQGGSFTLMGSGLAVAQSLLVQGDSSGAHVGVDIPAAFTNAGQITLDCLSSGPGCSNRTIVLSAATTLTNSGTISAIAANRTELLGNLVNTGTIAVAGPDVEFGTYNSANAGATLTNEGAITLAEGATLSTPDAIRAPMDIVNGAGGHIDATGTGTIEDGGPEATFEEGSGTTTGPTPVTLTQSATLDMTGTGASHFEMFQGGNYTLEGAGLSASQSLLIEGEDNAGHLGVAVAGAFVNAGRIEIACQSAANPCTTNQEAVSIASGALTNTGILETDAGIPVLINGALVNHGTFDVRADTRLDTAYAQSAGTTTLTGANAALTDPAGLTISGGTLGGAGTVHADVINAGTVSPSPSPATLTVDGDYTQQPAGFLHAQVGAAGADTLSVSGTATLGGTLQVDTAAGFTAAQGTTYQVLGATTRSGQFATTAGLGSHYSLAYGPAAVTLTALAPPTGPPALPELSIAGVSVPRPAGGTAPATFTVSLSAASPSPVTVAFATADGTAAAPGDYTATSGALTFAPGQTEQTVTVPVVGNEVPGADATFFVDLSAPSGASIGASRGTATIVNRIVAPDHVYPTSGGNYGSVLITVDGQGLGGQAAIRLVAPGKADIVATDVTATDGGRRLTAELALTGAPAGARDVVVTDGATAAGATLPGAFAVVAAKPASIALHLTGSATSGPGFTWTGTLTASDIGNVDAYGTLLEVDGFPAHTDVSVTSAPVGSDAADLVGLEGQTETGAQRDVTIALPHIPAGTSTAVGLSFIMPEAPSHSVVADLHPKVLIESTTQAAAASDPVQFTPGTVTVDAAGHQHETVGVSGAGGTGSVDVEMYKVAAPDGTSGPTFTTSTAGGVETLELKLPMKAKTEEGCAFIGDLTLDPAATNCSSAITPAGGAVSKNAMLGLGSISRKGMFAGPQHISLDLPYEIYEFFKLRHETQELVASPTELSEARETTEYDKSVVDCLVEHGHLDASAHGSLDPLAQLKTDAKLAEIVNLAVEKGPGTFIISEEVKTALDAVVDSAWGTALGSQLISDPQFNNTTANEGYAGRAGVLAAALKQVAIDCPPTTPKENHEPPPPPPHPTPDPPVHPIAETRPGDPNDMYGPQGPTASHWLTPASSPAYAYTAQFENMPSATAPAHTVVVTDKLDVSHLDPATFSLGPVSFSGVIVAPPPGVQSWSTQVDLRPALELIVGITAQLDPETEIATWRFASLDPVTLAPTTDALTGFLPVDTSHPAGVGTVSFEISPRGRLATGTKIANGADIVFDTNASIATPTWGNAIDATRPSTARTRVTRRIRRRGRKRVHALIVRWSSSDRGSGVAAYAVYRSVGHGRLRLFFAAATARQATIACRAGQTYRFAAVATDRVGNVQSGRRTSRAVRC
jgi:hypothetical protein